VGKRRQERQFSLVLLPQLGVRVERHAHDDAEQEHTRDKLLANGTLNETHRIPNVRRIVADPEQRVDVDGSIDDNREQQVHDGAIDENPSDR
jgi:hypothetical protein